MRTLQLDTIIEASRERVWEAITNETSFRRWTAVFAEGSHFEGGWNQGDTIWFLAPDDQQIPRGMRSEIRVSRYPEHISIRHLGTALKGIAEISEAQNLTAPYATEEYTLTETGPGQTRFALDMTMREDFYESFDTFRDQWIRALGLLKEIAEEHTGD